MKTKDDFPLAKSGRYPDTSKREFREWQNAMALRFQAGDRRVERDLVESLMGLVIKTTGRLRGSGCSHEDLIAAGCVGISEAIVRFDPARGDVAALAAQWIEAKMFDEARMGGHISLPNSKTAKKIMTRAASVVKALEALGATREEAVTAVVADENLDEESRQGLEVFLAAPSRMSVSSTGEHDEMTMSWLPAVRDVQTDLDDHGGVGKILERVMRVLNDREREVIARRFMVEKDDRVSLDVIAGDWEISRERVRQVEKRALEKLREALEARGLELSDLL